MKPQPVLPVRYQQALIAYEDRKFWGHPGFDPWALIRALGSNARSGRTVSGGSTLSMQCLRLSRPHGSRTMAAKFIELWGAVRLELMHDKAQVLCLYAAMAPFGGNVVGLSAAGFRWYGRPSSDLTWAEAATLAVLPNSPALIHPGRGRAELKVKRDSLLRTVRRIGLMDAEELGLAMAEPLPGEPVPMPALAPQLMSGPMPDTVVSTLDAQLQVRASAIAARHALRLSAQGIENLAALVVDNTTMEILAYIGNAPGATLAGMVDCARAARSSGSILKPFLYASMLDSGELTPGRLVPDIPTRVGSYSPENAERSYRGAVRADEALALSLNIPFVRLLRSYGVERFASLLERIGFTTLTRAPADYGLPLILGGAETSLFEAIAAYANLARAARGLPPEPSRPRWQASPTSMGNPNKEAVFSQGAAWLTLEALSTVRRPASEASWEHYASSLRVAWKTGTSFGAKDAWAIGVTRDYTVAVWAGNADGTGRPGLKGTDSAAPLLFDLFALLPRSDWIARPGSGLKTQRLCARSGYAAGPDCASVQEAYVPLKAQVDTACPYCRLVHLSADRKYSVAAQDTGLVDIVSQRRFVLPPTMEYFYRLWALDYEPLPPRLPGGIPLGNVSLEIVTPEEGSELYLPIELDGSPGEVVFRAVHRERGLRVFWHIDGDYLGETRGIHTLASRPLPGRHELILVDERGESITRRFVILNRDE